MSNASSLAIAVHRPDRPGEPGGEGGHQVRVGTALPWTGQDADRLRPLSTCQLARPAPEGKRLRHYAAQFPIVEVDSSGHGDADAGDGAALPSRARRRPSS